MITQKPTYRFFVAFLSVAVFIATAMPVVAQGNGLAQKLCELFMADAAVTMNMDAGHCSLQQKTMNMDSMMNHDENSESCHATLSCLCSLNSLPIGDKAPVPQNNSNKIGVIHVVVVSLGSVSLKPLTVADPPFIETSEYSPPLFLKNCSFLI